MGKPGELLNVDLPLGEGSFVVGRVVDASDEPVADASVYIYEDTAHPDSGVVSSIAIGTRKTSKSGTFIVRILDSNGIRYKPKYEGK